MNKVLLIDDNHSFIDMFKNLVLPLRLKVDAVQKYRPALELLAQNGEFLNQKEYQKLIQFSQKQTRAAKEKDEEAKGNSGDPEKMVITDPLYREEGYFLIVVEQDTEASIKGVDFIRDQLSRNGQFTPDNFILLTGNEDKVESAAKKLGVAVFEKPLKRSNVLNAIQARVQKLEQIKSTAEKIIAENKIEIKIPGLQKKGKGSAASRKKQTSKKN